MKKLIPQLVILSLIFMIFSMGQLLATSEMTYWDFLTYKYVLNIGMAFGAILTGYFIKNYYVILLGSTFVLAVYFLAFMFDSKEFLTPFFFASYTVFIGFSTIANLVRHYKEWLLKIESQN